MFYTLTTFLHMLMLLAHDVYLHVLVITTVLVNEFCMASGTCIASQSLGCRDAEGVNRKMKLAYLSYTLPLSVSLPSKDQ